MKQHPAPNQAKFKIGILKDQVTGPGPDFLEPMSEGELDEWEGGGDMRSTHPTSLKIADDMENSS